MGSSNYETGAGMYTDLTPHVGSAVITQTDAVPASDGASTGATVVLMYCAFKAGTNGSYVYKIRFMPQGTTAALASTATTLRVFLSTVATVEGAAAGATTIANTHLLAEVATPAVTTAATTAAVTPFEVPLNISIPTGMHILVCQHVAQANAVTWCATVFGGDR